MDILEKVTFDIWLSVLRVALALMINLNVVIFQNDWKVFRTLMLIHLLLNVSILQDPHILNLLLMSLGEVFKLLV